MNSGKPGVVVLHTIYIYIYIYIVKLSHSYKNGNSARELSRVILTQHELHLFQEEKKLTKINSGKPGVVVLHIIYIFST
jgi:predicted nucleic acid binding AN1-type Zn finger protein